MWVCQNCGTSDETEDVFDEELDVVTGETVRYCPECGSDEVIEADDDDDGEGFTRPGKDGDAVVDDDS